MTNSTQDIIKRTSLLLYACGATRKFIQNLYLIQFSVFHTIHIIASYIKLHHIGIEPSSKKLLRIIFDFEYVLHTHYNLISQFYILLQEKKITIMFFLALIFFINKKIVSFYFVCSTLLVVFFSLFKLYFFLFRRRCTDKERKNK